VQRRVKVTISHESGSDLEWDRVIDLTIGNVRTPGASADPGTGAGATPAISLGILPSLSAKTTGDDRTVLILEANWDSARHNSLYLNRVTPSDDSVCVTLAMLIGVKGCARPVAIKQDLMVRIQARQKRGWGSKMMGFMGPKIDDVGRVSQIYDMVMRPATNGAPTSAVLHQRGDAWRPRSKSLLAEHADTMAVHEKLYRVEQMRQVLKLNEALQAAQGVAVPASPVKGDGDGQVEAPASLALGSPKGQALAQKCCAILLASSPTQRAAKAKAAGAAAGAAAGTDGLVVEKKLPPVPLVPEVRMIEMTNPVIIRGYLLFLETRSDGWVKRWAYISKPYLYITDHEKDPVVRVVIRLSDITIQFNEDQGNMMGVKNMFTICTQHRGFLVQTLKPRDMETWLYHFDPLLAGTIASRLGLNAAVGKRI
jgi:kinesin family protein 1